MKRSSYQSPGVGSRMCRQQSRNEYCSPESQYVQSVPTGHSYYSPEPFRQNEHQDAKGRRVRIDINININLNINQGSGQHSRHRKESGEKQQYRSKVQKSPQGMPSRQQPIANLAKSGDTPPEQPAILSNHNYQLLARKRSLPLFELQTPVQHFSTSSIHSGSNNGLTHNPTTPTIPIVERENIHIISPKAQPRINSPEPMRPQLNGRGSLTTINRTIANKPNQDLRNRPAHRNSKDPKIVLADEEEAPAFIPLPPLVAHSQYPSCSFKEPFSEPHSSASYSQVQTCKLHFECTSPIRLVQPLMANNEDAGERQKDDSIETLQTPIKLMNEDSLVVNRGLQNFINPEDLPSISSIRSLQQPDSISLQKICSMSFFRRNDFAATPPQQTPQQKSYTQHFPYVIKEDPHNEQTDSCGPSAQGSNLRSSGTSVAHHLKKEQEQAFASKKELLDSNPAIESTEAVKKKPSGASPEVSCFSYRFDRKPQAGLGTSSKLRDARIVHENAKVRLPRNNLALWDMQ